MPDPSAPTVVRCRMVDADIDVALCDAEQRPRDCRGCTAMTRRCAQCKNARGIADPEAGLCPRCADLRRADVADSGQDGPAELEDVLGRLRDITEAPEGEPAIKTGRAGSDNADPLPSPLLKNPQALFPTLMEHGEERDGRWLVRAPAAILMGRFHLLRPEAVAALEALREKGHLEGTNPWNEAILRTTENIEELQLSITKQWRNVDAPAIRDRITRNIGGDKAAVQSRSGSHRKQPPGGTATPRPALAPAAPSPTKSRSARVEMDAILETKATRLLEEAHAHLWQQSRGVGATRHVSAAIPLLQLRFKGSDRQTVEILEALERKKLVERVDGWRSLHVFPAPTVPADQARQEPQKPQAPLPAAAKSAPLQAAPDTTTPAAPATPRTVPGAAPTRTDPEGSNKPTPERETAVRILRTHVRNGRVEDPIEILSQAMEIPEPRASDLVSQLCRSGPLQLIRNDDEVYRWNEPPDHTPPAEPQRAPAQPENKNGPSKNLEGAVRRIQDELGRLVEEKEALERRIAFLESAASAVQNLAHSPTEAQAAITEAILAVAATIDEA